MPPSPGFRPATRHAEPGEEFFDLVAAAPFPRHVLRWRNQPWAARVGLGGLSDAEWIEHFGRFAPLRELFARFAPAADVALDHGYFAGPRPCTMLVEDVEALWTPTAEADDWSAFLSKLDRIAGMAEAYGTVPKAP